MPDIEQRLADSNIILPSPAIAVANYLPAVLSGDILYVSGQLPMQDGAVAVTGLLGDDVSLEDGIAAAKLCGINIIAQVKAALEGDLSRVKRCVKLGGFVASTPTFTDHPKVINGASDLMVNIFGDIGRHARAAVGVAVLPLNAAVEIEAVFEVAV